MSSRHTVFCDADSIEYQKIEGDFVSTIKVDDRSILKVKPEALVHLAETAFHDISFKLRTKHLQQIASIASDNGASLNDRFVTRTLLHNAAIAGQGVLPLCQDTGTAIIIAEKGECVWTVSNDADSIAEGVRRAYESNNLRYSQTIAQSMYVEQNSNNNLPAQIDIHAVEGNEYNFVFIAKGGGSANKTMLFQETKALLQPQNLQPFLLDKIKNLGTSGCPPYHVAIVVGGTSAEENLRTVKLASAKCYDGLPSIGDNEGNAFRDLDLENYLCQEANRIGYGAQFGGNNFVLDVRVVRLPRHGASCPIGIGVSCVADRNIRAKINSQGLWLEQLEANPARFIEPYNEPRFNSISIDLNRPMPQILEQLSQFAVGTQLLLNGEIIVARDIAHARLKERLDLGLGLPDYFKSHPIYYAGPAKKPVGLASGSFGPTTAGRMDSYIETFQEQGACLITIAKGGRSKTVTDCCRRFGGFYLGSIGGAAAALAHDCIKSIELVEFPELGMEAIYRINVENFPAFILVDNKGNNFYQK